MAIKPISSSMPLQKGQHLSFFLIIRSAINQNAPTPEGWERFQYPYAVIIFRREHGYRLQCYCATALKKISN